MAQWETVVYGWSLCACLGKAMAPEAPGIFLIVHGWAIAFLCLPVNKWLVPCMKLKYQVNVSSIFFVKSDFVADATIVRVWECYWSMCVLQLYDALICHKLCKYAFFWNFALFSQLDLLTLNNTISKYCFQWTNLSYSGTIRTLNISCPPKSNENEAEDWGEQRCRELQ
jgi:hypothetical protein